jgi:hypothetical protein
LINKRLNFFAFFGKKLLYFLNDSNSFPTNFSLIAFLGAQFHKSSQLSFHAYKAIIGDLLVTSFKNELHFVAIPNFNPLRLFDTSSAAIDKLPSSSNCARKFKTAAPVQ